MILNCSSKELFDHDCEYGGLIDTEKVGYSIRDTNGNTKYYHYLCFQRSAKEQILLQSKHKTKLCNYLLNLKAKGMTDTWVSGVLSSCGYKDGDITTD